MNNENYLDLFLLDPSQKEFLALSQKEQLLRLVSPSQSSALDAIGKFLEFELTQCKKCIIVLEDSQDQQKIIQYLGNIKLSKFCLPYSVLNTKLSEKDRIRLKLWCAKSDFANQEGRDELIKNKIVRAKDLIKDAYASIHQKIFGEQTWIDLVDRVGILHKKIPHTIIGQQVNIQSLKFTQKEFWHIKGKIQRLKDLYNPSFPKIEKQINFHPTLFQHSDQAQTIHTLEKFLQNALDLRLNLSDYLVNYSLSLENKWRSRFQKLTFKLNELDELHDDLRWYSSRPGLQLSQKIKTVFSGSKTNEFSGFEKTQKLLNEIESIFTESNCKDAPISIDELDLELIDSDEFIGLRKYWDDIISSWNEHMQSDIEKNLSRLNKYNSENKALIKLESEIEKFILELNGSNIFNHIFEDNALSCKKRIKSLQEIQQALEEAVSNLIQFPEYSAWHLEKHDLSDSCQAIYDLIKNLKSSSWSLAFEKWYISQIVNTHASCAIPGNDQSINRWSEQWKEAKKVFAQITDYQWSKIREKALDNIKSDNKTIFLSLFKKSQQLDFDWMDLFMADAKSFSDIYPILLIDQSSFEKFNLLSKEHWDHIIFLQVTDKENINQKLGNRLSKQAIVNYNLDDKNKLDAQKPAFGKLELEVNLLESIKRNAQNESIGLVDHLHRSKIIASHLAVTAGTGRIFQLKNVLIVSFLTNVQNQLILSYLKESRVKELNPEYDFELTLQDSLIDLDRQWVIFQNDGLLNSENLDHFNWQLHIIETLSSQGVIFYNQWTLENLENWGEQLHRQCKEIVHLNRKQDFESHIQMESLK